MESRTTAILLMLALVALVVGATAVTDDTLRLPSDPVMADGITRPWDCCDFPVCPEGGKGMWCGCADVVGKCAAACKSCKPVGGTGPVGYQCRETTKNGPGPKCNP